MPSENPRMSADSLSIPAESLLEHREFVRRLAQSLARDEHAAQDLVQETWLEALRRPPHSTSKLRAWLASVVRTRARNKARGEARRTSSEQAAAREEADRSEHRLRERFAMQHKVVEAVLALREPYKTVVLLRYYEGLSPSAIAARRGAPSGTVRAQLTRAHELLRERLDAEFGGERAAWSAWLLALARPRGMALGPKLALVGALCLAAAIPAALHLASPSGKTAPPLAASRPRDLVAATPAVDPGSLAVPASAASDRAAIPGEAREVVASRTAPVLPSAEIRARFLLPDGSPAKGVSLAVEGRALDHELLEKFGAPKDWSVPVAESGSDGSLSIPLDPPPAFTFFARAALDGFCSEEWRWNAIDPGTTKDLGDVTLRPGGAVVGRIVDVRDRPVQQAWIVYAEGVNPASTSGKEPVRGRAQADRATGEFRIDGLAAGPNKLTAYARVASWIQGPSVEIRAGEVVHADIRYDGPDLGSRITVRLSTEPGFLVDESPPEVVLEGPGIETRRLRGSRNLAFEDVPPGVYALSIDDPRFRAWSATGVAPGQDVSAKLLGSASLHLSVVDAKTGEAVPRYSAIVHFDRTDWRPNTVALVPRDTDPPEDGRFDGLLASDQTLIVASPGYADLVLPLAGLRPDEVREVQARMSHGATLSGRVVQGAAKKTLPGVEVHLVPAVPRDAAFRLLPSRTSPDVRSTRSDENGRFVFTLLPSGTFDVVAEWRPGIVAEADGVPLGATETKEDVELALPAVGRLRGRVLGPEGASYEGLSLYARPARETTEEGSKDLPTYRCWTPPQELRAPLSADGSFDLSLEAGANQVTLEFPMVLRPTGFNSTAHEEGAWVELGTVDVRPDGDTVHDFDLRSAFPGTVRFSATLAGAPAVGAVVEVLGENELRPISAAAVLDDHGQARIGPLPPRSYKLLLRAADTEWFYCAPSVLEVRAASESRMSVDVPLLAGELNVVNADSGEPFTSPQLLIRLDGNPRSPAAAIHTDAEGRAKIRLPPARYLLGRGYDRESGNAPGAVAFDWTEHGSSPAVLRLERAGEDK